jgi:hypothetical protein
MKAALSLLILLFSAPLHSDDSAKGAFEQFAEKRPTLGWERLKGYRLFFHPDDPESTRHALSVAVPTERKILGAWSLVRPLKPNPEFKDAWMRIEGVPQEGRVAFNWDGTYRGAVFPDEPYYYEVHLRFQGGDKVDETVAVLKSKEHPAIVKLGSQKLDAHPLIFRRGEFQAGETALELSLAESPLPVVARVLAPPLEGAFAIEGIQLSYRMTLNAEGKAPRAQPWSCACQESLPADSPARSSPKKVQCLWELQGLSPGTYELKLALYHRMKHPGQFDPCDTPILDEDRVRVLLRP